jgi:hypothetical protein
MKSLRMAPEYLDAKADGKLYGDVSDREHAIGIAFTRLIEDHLYWMVVASRWLDGDWFDCDQQPGSQGLR